MSLSRQVHVYSLDTSDFYNQEEAKIHKYLNKYYIYRKQLKDKLAKPKYSDKKEMISKHITKINKRIKIRKQRLCDTFKLNNNIRVLNRDKLLSKKVVSIFESSTTRVIGIPTNTLTEDMVIVQTYFFDVLKDIIVYGFTLDNDKYVPFTASAGQIRNKKTVFIKESVLKTHQDTLMCGLTIEKINADGGVNINKYLAYLALNNSATDLWEEFDITKTIVVDDMETTVNGIVDFIDDKTYKITRKKMDVAINHTDGCGMMLPSVSGKNFMIRLPWVKGLLVSFDYNKFIKEHSSSGIVKDIYGKEWDVVKDDIQVIFTKGQFKMYKYYKSWKDYCDKFIEFKCQAGKCNEEEDYFEDAKTNYQMVQTLTDIADEELEYLVTKTNDNIKDISNNKQTMLRLLGVTRANKKKNYIQQALELYPPLLRDTYSREIIKKVRKSLIKEGKSGKLEILGKYTFMSPDFYAVCEYLFLGNENPVGLLKDSEVYCNIYKECPKLDCLRSPHLYREHAVRNNVIDDVKSKWFVTDAIYTSCHDLISKILQFDVDGDKSLVCADKTLIDIAERNMKDIVPLYYNMAKAGSINIDSNMIFSGLKLAYTGGNIGMISNDITKIWNSDNINLDVIKICCMENNFTIDYAKTLYKPERPIEKNKLITSYTKSKTPNFFIYAKNKEVKQVESVNNSTVNRLGGMIVSSKRWIGKDVDLGEFDYKLLMKDADICIDEKVVERYKKLDLKQMFAVNKNEEKQILKCAYKYQNIRSEILKINPDIYYVTDVLVKYLYEQKKSNYKTTLWESFGDIIVENIRRNIIVGNIFCDKCGELIEIKSNRHKMCRVCWKEYRRKYKTNKQKQYRSVDS